MKIVAAAIKSGDLILTMPRPYRHNDIIKATARLGADMPLENEVQGFMTENNTFVDRVVAMNLARDAGQLLWPDKRAQSTVLYSEDIW